MNREMLSNAPLRIAMAFATGVICLAAASSDSSAQGLERDFLFPFTDPVDSPFPFSMPLDPADATGAFSEVSWVRGDEGSSFAAWENFSLINGANPAGAAAQGPIGINNTPQPILPDGGAADLFVDSNGATITSSENYYLTGEVADFSVEVTGEDLGAGYDSRIVLQTGTLGSALLSETGGLLEAVFSLQYVDANGETVVVEPSFGGLVDAFNVPPAISTFGGRVQHWSVGWEIEGFSPSEYEILFEAGNNGNISFSTLVFDALVTPATVPAPGDYNGDGEVSRADFDTFLAEFGQSVSAGEGADGNGDGLVDAADYTIWRDALASTPTTAAIAVPEPSGVIALSLLATFEFCVGSHILTRSRRRL